MEKDLEIISDMIEKKEIKKKSEISIISQEVTRDQLERTITDGLWQATNREDTKHW